LDKESRRNRRKVYVYVGRNLRNYRKGRGIWNSYLEEGQKSLKGGNSPRSEEVRRGE